MIIEFDLGRNLALSDSLIDAAQRLAALRTVHTDTAFGPGLWPECPLSVSECQATHASLIRLK
jgi:hypothetical protein